jgi:hypothetical protein
MRADEILPRPMVLRLFLVASCGFVWNVPEEKCVVFSRICSRPLKKNRRTAQKWIGRIIDTLTDGSMSVCQKNSESRTNRKNGSK